MGIRVELIAYEVTEEYAYILHKAKLHIFHFSLITNINKSRSMRWAGPGTCGKLKKCILYLYWENGEETIW
jgi:hypothetical protein